MRMKTGSGNVFRDIGFDKAEAENLKLRSELMMRIEDRVKASGLTQAAAAKSLGLTQTRLNALLKGKIQLFSLDALVKIAIGAGLQVRLLVEEARRHTPEYEKAMQAALSLKPIRFKGRFLKRAEIYDRPALRRRTRIATAGRS